MIRKYKYNKEDLSIDYESRAKRPILEYKADLQLFNFGSKSIQNIDVIDDSTVEPFSEIEGSVGYYIDQVLLQSGYRVIFNNANDPEVRSKVYVVNFTTTTNTIELVSSNDRRSNTDVYYQRKNFEGGDASCVTVPTDRIP